MTSANVIPSSFPEAVRLHFESLTRAQKGLARYIVDHTDQAAFLTARQLGDATGQSDAAVVRFARAVGYSGFQEMRSALREGLLERVGAGGMGAAAAGSAAGEELRDEVFLSDSARIDATARLNPIALGERVADRLISSRRIWVTGHGTTYPLALLLSMQLNQVLGTCETLTVGNGDVADRLRQIGPDDVLIGIGYARYLPYTIELMNVAKKLGAHIIAITDKPSSPLAQLAADSFLVGREATSFGWWSQVGTMSIINWLVALAMTRNGERANALLQRSDEVWRLLAHWDPNDVSHGDRSLAAQLDDRLRQTPESNTLSSMTTASVGEDDVVRRERISVEAKPSQKPRKKSRSTHS